MIEKINACKNAQKLYVGNSLPIKTVIETVEKQIASNIDLIIDAAKLDNIYLEEQAVKNSIKYKPENKYGQIGEAFNNEYGQIVNSYVPYGVFCALYDNSPYVTLELIMLALHTKNGLILNVEKNPMVTHMIVEQFNRVLSQLQVKNLIVIHSNLTGKKIEKSDEIDGIISIGHQKDKYTVGNQKIIRSDYGKYSMYVNEEIDTTLLMKMKELGVEIIEGKDVDEAINYINNSNLYSVGIMTSNRETARHFVSGVKSRNVFVNASPTLERSLDIDIEDLLYKKSFLLARDSD